MAKQRSTNSLTCSLLILLGLVGSNVVVVVVVGGVTPSHDTALLNRSSFPRDFVFGTASSAYQYEGAADEGGRGPSIWDTFTHRYPERIQDGSNGDVAIDSYSGYKEDVALMKDMGTDAYRFSISWSRILPNGKLSGGVNKEGIEYYNNLVDELLSKGIQPYVTLFHWDLPQALEDEYGGFLSPKIVNHFREYTGVCFKEFGDRVKHWITLNEPSAYGKMGYALGIFAPGRCSNWINPNCRGGDSATEPYIVTHHQLLAHAAAVKLYKDEYQAKQKGLIGITLVSIWFVPLSNAKRHRSAAARALDFQLGWYMDPLTRGDYPHSMKSLLGNRLPKFTEKQARLLNGSFDFVGLNYYTANYAAHMPPSNAINASYLTDARALLSNKKKGIHIGPMAASNWLCIYPKGLGKLLLRIKTKYNHPLIYITENGIDEHNNATLTLQEALDDKMRVDYHRKHLSFVQKAIKDGVNVKGYFAWSLLDNFEWSSGYTVRFGIHYVDYKNGSKKYPKLSARWFKSFLKK